MNTPPATIEVDGYQLTSSSETVAEMIKAHTPKDDKASLPREVKPIRPEKEAEESPLSKAASEMGKKGGEAAAKARAKEAKAKEPVKEAKPSEEATEDEATEAKGEAEEEKPLGKPRDDPKARIAVLARERREAEERADRAERRAEEAERRQREAPAPAREERREAKPAADDDPEPQEDAFPNYPDFVKATGRWAARQENKEIQAKASREREAHEYTRAIGQAAQTFKERIGKATEADPEFIERTRDFAAGLRPSFMRGEGEKLTGAHVVADEIIRSESAPLLLAHLADNQEEFQRIASLRTPTEIQLAMAKLEGRLERLEGSDAAITDTSSEPEVSRARRPPSPVGGSPHIASGEPRDDSSYDEHARFYNAKEKATRKR